MVQFETSQSTSQYHKIIQRLADYAKYNARRTGKNPYKDMLKKFMANDREDLHVVKRILQSLADGQISEENKNYFDSVTIREVDGSF